MPWLAGLVGRLDASAFLAALEQLKELGTTALVPVLKEQTERARLVSEERAARIEATIRALQADARGDVGAVSLAATSGGDLGLAEPPRHRPERQRT
jgi:hypothetical protein